MAGNLATSPTFALQPSAKQVALPSNYISNFDFLSQYLPETYSEEFERYGNRSVSSFLRLVGAELPFASDLIKWTEQGRLHTKYTQVGAATGTGGSDTVEFQVNDTISGSIAIRVGQTLVVSQNDGSGSNKGIVTAVATATNKFTVAFYEAGGLVTAGTGVGNSDVTVFIYGSEFQKGTASMSGSLEAQTDIFENSPIILKDHYEVAGSDMAQIGWVEVNNENGDTGYLWYLKSAGETRTRFEDYMETSVVEAVPAQAGSGAIGHTNAVAGKKGSDGLFYSVEARGNVWSGGNPDTLSEFDAIVSRLDKQGAIEENVWFLNRSFTFDIDDMLAAQNSYGAGGTSYGLFNNDKDMALNLGFDGFRRGYDFYKTDWKYLNDPTMRGDLPSDNISGLMVPAGTKTIYDQVLGKNAKRPFLHVRYRASETEDRRMKTWSEGGAGGYTNSGVDKMDIHFLTERALCTLGANNFFLVKN